MAKTGKIFGSSNNVYDDQAKILFDYYKQCAERIVAQEEEIEQEVDSLLEDRKIVEESLTGWWNKFLNFILFRTSTLKAQMLMIDNKLEKLNKDKKNIFRDYKVKKMGVVYVPIAEQVKYDKNSFLVDFTGVVQPSEVMVQVPRNSQLLTDTIKKISDSTKSIPLVDSSNEAEAIDTSEYSASIQEIKQGDYIGSLDRSMRTLSFCMSDLKRDSVELPLVEKNSEYIDYIKEYATDEIDDKGSVVSVLNEQQYANRVAKFKEISALQDSITDDTNDLEEVLEQIMKTVSGTVETVVRVKLATTDKLMARSNNVLYQILKSPYNHYSPLLEAEEIQRIKNETFDYADNTQGYEPFNLKESSRVRYDLLGGTWTAEDGTSTTRPFGVHQIYEEIVAPLVSNLMQENRVERLKIYNHIHDQKLSYVNKWHQDVDAFYRSNHAESSDIINNMQKTLSEYISSYNVLVQLQKTMDGMKKNQSLDNATVEVEDKSQEALVAFDIERKKYEKVQEDFSAFMDRLQDDIALKAEEFGHVEFYDARLRDGYSNKVAVASYEVSDMDERRKQMALSNPLLAKEALLPPKPNVDSVTYEQLSINLPKMVENALENIEANANNVATNVSADRETNGQNNVVDNENINENKERF